MPATLTDAPSAVHRAHVDHAAVVGALRRGGQLGRHTAIGRQRGRVDEGHLLVDNRREQAAQRRKPKYLNIFGRKLTADLDGQRDRRFGRQRPDEHAQLPHQVEPRGDLLADDAAADVDRVGHELAGQRQLDRSRDVGAGAVLGLLGGRTQMGCHDHLRQIEQRAVGARLGGEHVHTGRPHVPADDGVGERLLVDQTAARGVDDDHAGLGLGQRLRADQARGLRGLRQVHRDEVGAGQQVVERQQFDAELSRARLRHVRVVGDDVGAEGRQPLGHQLADPAQAHHANGLAVDLGARRTTTASRCARAAWRRRRESAGPLTASAPAHARRHCGCSTSGR